MIVYKFNRIWVNLSLGPFVVNAILGFGSRVCDIFPRDRGANVDRGINIFCLFVVRFNSITFRNQVSTHEHFAS